MARGGYYARYKRPYYRYRATGYRRGGGGGLASAVSAALRAVKRQEARAAARAGPYAARRRANLSSYMRNLWAKYPRKSNAETDELLKASPEGLSISGLGDYSLGSGSSAGSRVGAWLGDKAHSLFTSLTGLGDYALKSNSLLLPAGQGAAVPNMAANDPPSIVNSPNRGVTIRHREYIGDLITSATPGAFQISTFSVNPGDPVTFPWLAQIANHFQEWRPDGIVFEFKTMASDMTVGTNLALGQVIMGSQYNVDQPVFTTKYEMENTEYSSSCKPSVSMMHGLECERHSGIQDQMYVAPNGVIPAGGTKAFYKMCNTSIATNGFQGSSVNIGEVWVSYEVTLFKPIMETSFGVEELLYGRSTRVSGVTGNNASLLAGTATVFGDPAPEFAAGTKFTYHSGGTNGGTLTITCVDPSGCVGRTLLVIAEWTAYGGPNITRNVPLVQSAVVSDCNLKTPNIYPGQMIVGGVGGVPGNTAYAQSVTCGICVVPTANTFSVSMNPTVTGLEYMPSSSTGGSGTTRMQLWIFEVPPNWS